MGAGSVFGIGSLGSLPLPHIGPFAKTPRSLERETLHNISIYGAISSPSSPSTLQVSRVRRRIVASDAVAALIAGLAFPEPAEPWRWALADADVVEHPSASLTVYVDRPATASPRRSRKTQAGRDSGASSS